MFYSLRKRGESTYILFFYHNNVSTLKISILGCIIFMISKYAVVSKKRFETFFSYLGEFGKGN